MKAVRILKEKIQIKNVWEIQNKQMILDNYFVWSYIWS